MCSQATRDEEIATMSSTKLIQLAVQSLQSVRVTNVMMVTRNGSASPATLKKYWQSQRRLSDYT
jgi:hypothetical protein